MTFEFAEARKQSLSFPVREPCTNLEAVFVKQQSTTMRMCNANYETEGTNNAEDDLSTFTSTIQHDVSLAPIHLNRMVPRNLLYNCQWQKFHWHPHEYPRFEGGLFYP